MLVVSHSIKPLCIPLPSGVSVVYDFSPTPQIVRLIAPHISPRRQTAPLIDVESCLFDAVHRQHRNSRMTNTGSCCRCGVARQPPKTMTRRVDGQLLFVKRLNVKKYNAWQCSIVWHTAVDSCNPRYRDRVAVGLHLPASECDARNEYRCVVRQKAECYVCVLSLLVEAGPSTTLQSKIWEQYHVKCAHFHLAEGTTENFFQTHTTLSWKPHDEWWWRMMMIRWWRI